MKPKPIALIDLDGTLCDYEGAIRRDLAKLAAPGEIVEFTHSSNDPGHIQNRIDLIRLRKDWWFNLAELEDGFKIVFLLRQFNFALHVATKGPSSKPLAWEEKLRWIRLHLPDAAATITEDKSLLYGKVLVDDFPDYANRWLEWRKNGLVIMPDRPSTNAGFEHPQVIRFDGSPESVQIVSQKLRQISELFYAQLEG